MREKKNTTRNCRYSKDIEVWKEGRMDGRKEERKEEGKKERE